MKTGKISKLILGAALLVGALQLQAEDKPADKTTDPSGTYVWTVPARNGGGDRTNTLTLKYESEKLTGKLSSPGRNGQNSESEIINGKVAGSEISFTVVRSFNNNNFTNKYSGKLEDGAIKGKFEFTNRNGESQSRDWEAKLQK